MQAFLIIGGGLPYEITYQLLGAINNGPPLLKTEYYKQLVTGAGNYETILQEFQRLHSADSNNNTILECLIFIEKAIQKCFFDMDKLYEGKTAGINNAARYNAEVFLSHFDTIFTINQDLLIERHFINLFSSLLFRSTANPNRNGTILPAIRGYNRLLKTFDVLGNQDIIIKVADVPVDIEKESKGFLPYIKLHGSYNWQAENNNRLMISGGEKDQQINNSPLLRSYFDYFSTCISQSDTLIVAIGYGFLDNHINRELLKAFNHGAKLYIIDPQGFDSIRRSGLIESVEGNLYGSPRTFRDMFLDLNQTKQLFHELFYAPII